MKLTPANFLDTDDAVQLTDCLGTCIQRRRRAAGARDQLFDPTPQSRHSPSHTRSVRQQTRPRHFTRRGVVMIAVDVGADADLSFAGGRHQRFRLEAINRLRRRRGVVSPPGLLDVLLHGMLLASLAHAHARAQLAAFDDDVACWR